MATGCTWINWANSWLMASLVPQTSHITVVLPEIFFTFAASQKPSSRNRWLIASLPPNLKISACTPGASKQSGTVTGQAECGVEDMTEWYIGRLRLVLNLYFL